MPVRKLTERVLKWPRADAVFEALVELARNLSRSREDVAAIDYFGSFARGDWGVASDLDVLVVVGEEAGPIEHRTAGIDTLVIPVPVDLPVYTEGEW